MTGHQGKINCGEGEWKWGKENRTLILNGTPELVNHYSHRTGKPL